MVHHCPFTQRSGELGPIARTADFAQQKRLAFKEQVTLYTDSSKNIPYSNCS